MTEAEWVRCRDPEPMLRYVDRMSPERLNLRKLALVVVGWGHQNERVMLGGMMIHACELLELWADNCAADRMLEAHRLAEETFGSSLDRLASLRVLGVMLPYLRDAWCDSAVDKAVYISNA